MSKIVAPEGSTPEAAVIKDFEYARNELAQVQDARYRSANNIERVFVTCNAGLHGSKWCNKPIIARSKKMSTVASAGKGVNAFIVLPDWLKEKQHLCSDWNVLWYPIKMYATT